MRILGIDFAPLSIPLERRLQTLAVFHHVSMFLFFGTASAFVLLFLLFTPFFWVTWAYAAWYIYDRDQSSRGGRRLEWARRLRLWIWLRDYFPVRLIKTADLDPSCNYIIGAHPHGIMGLGTFSALLTEANGFSELFPGITNHMLSLKLMHYLPFYREYVMALGVCDVSKESIQYIMKQKGNAVTIVVGGAKEVFDAYPGENKLVLKSRKGFVKMAIQTGVPSWNHVDVRKVLEDLGPLGVVSPFIPFRFSFVSYGECKRSVNASNLVLKYPKNKVNKKFCETAHLVPSYSFGENEVYSLLIHSTPDSTVRKIQRFLQVKFGVAPVVILGRGIFNYTFGFLPYRRPITVVVGRPIAVQKNPNPTQEDIDEVHQKYMDELKYLFDFYKAECGHKNAELEFID